jgi:hypothetical protein
VKPCVELVYAHVKVIWKLITVWDSPLQDRPPSITAAAASILHAVHLLRFVVAAGLAAVIAAAAAAAACKASPAGRTMLTTKHAAALTIRLQDTCVAMVLPVYQAGPS